MPMNEVIRAIEKADTENMQDIMRAAMNRYKELYPDWRMLFISADVSAEDKHSREILKLINKANKIIVKS